MSIYEDIYNHQRSLGYLGGTRRTKKFSMPKVRLPRPEIFRDDSGEMVRFKKFEDCYLPDELKRQKEPAKYRKMSVTVNVAESEEGHDLNGLADLYVKIGEETPGDGDNRLCFRTPYVKKSLVAKLEFTATVLYDPTQKEHRLLVELWDDDLLKDDYIGGAIKEVPIDPATGSITPVYKERMTMWTDDEKRAGCVTISIGPL